MVDYSTMPHYAQCLTCDRRFFDLRHIGGTCPTPDCNGYVTGKRRAEPPEAEQ